MLCYFSKNRVFGALLCEKFNFKCEKIASLKKNSQIYLNINIKGLFLHITSTMLQSVG